MQRADVFEEVKELVNAVKKTDVYCEYLTQLNKLKAQKELMDKVNAYRKTNFELQHSMDDEDAFERMEAFEREYEKFREIPLVSDFLKAELAFCRMMQEVNLEITREINFDLEE